jgi:hypothetical protein
MYYEHELFEPCGVMHGDFTLGIKCNGKMLRILENFVYNAIAWSPN